MDDSFSHSMLKVNGIQYHVVQAGPQSGIPVILLHGFPEYWYGWKNQIGPLVNAGFRVIIPDQRGYNLSEKPRGLSAYRVDTLAKDIVELIDVLGYAKASVVGHDWGGVVAWLVAALYPERVEKLVVMDAPYLSVTFQSIWKHPEQLLKSYYMALFQIPGLPEKFLQKDHFQNMVKSMLKTSPPGTFSSTDFEGYREAWAQTEALTSMLNWYRALFRRRVSIPRKPVFLMPVMILWGGNDFALGRELAEASLQLCQHGKLVILEKVNHWIQHEQPARVNELLIDFLKMESNQGSSSG